MRKHNYGGKGEEEIGKEKEVTRENKKREKEEEERQESRKEDGWRKEERERRGGCSVCPQHPPVTQQIRSAREFTVSSLEDDVVQTQEDFVDLNGDD